MSRSSCIEEGQASCRERGAMADTSGIPDTIRREVNSRTPRAPSAPVSRWIRPQFFPGSTPFVNSAVATRTNLARRIGSKNGPNGSNGSNGANGRRLARVSPIELLEIEMLRKPSSSRTDRPAVKEHSTTAPRSQRHGIQRQSRPQPTSPATSALSFCEWCREPLGPRNQSGRKRVYCSQSCRQRAYQSRKRSKQLGLREGELVVSSVLVARMNRRLKVLETALEVVENAELHMTDNRIADLCQAARRLRRLVVGPPTR